MRKLFAPPNFSREVEDLCFHRFQMHLLPTREEPLS